MNSENSNNSEPDFLIFNLTDKLDLKRGAKSIAFLPCLSIYYTYINIKSSFNNCKFEISGRT